MNVIKANSAKVLMNMIGPESNLFRPHFDGCLFRGQGNAKWSIVPRALRDNERIPWEGTLLRTPLRTCREQIKTEMGSLQQVKDHASRRGYRTGSDAFAGAVACPLELIRESDGFERGEEAWPSAKYLPLLCEAQHYGLPTRLIEWTYDPYFAAYFAARDAIRLAQSGRAVRELAVFGMIGLHSVQNYPFGGEQISVCAKDHDRRGYRYQLVSLSEGNSPDLHAQRSVFLCFVHLRFSANDPVEIRSLERYLKEVQDEESEGGLPGFSSQLCKITLSVDQAPELLRLLDRRGYDASAVRPGIQGCVDAVFEKCEEELEDFEAGSQAHR